MSSARGFKLFRKGKVVIWSRTPDLRKFGQLGASSSREFALWLCRAVFGAGDDRGGLLLPGEDHVGRAGAGDVVCQLIAESGQVDALKQALSGA